MTRSGNDDLDALFQCRTCKISCSLRASMSRSHCHFIRNLKFIQNIRRFLHDRKIGITAHYDSDF